MTQRYVYLYALAHKGYVFYIGITDWPTYRYQQHCTKGLEVYTNVYDYVYWILEQDELPDMLIIDHFTSYGSAEMAEAALIRFHVQLGHKLCNHLHNPQFNKIITCRPDKPKTNRAKPGYARFVDQKVKDHFKNYGQYNRYLSVGYATSISDRVRRNGSMYSQLDRPKEDRKQEDFRQSIDISQ